MTHFDDLSKFQQLLYCNLLARDIYVAERLYEITRPIQEYEHHHEVVNILVEMRLMSLDDTKKCLAHLYNVVRPIAEIGINDTLLPGTPAFLQHCNTLQLAHG